MTHFAIIGSIVLALAGCATPPASLPGHVEHHHHMRFQNGYVRVMETRLEPGEETLPHSHPIEAAVVFLTAGDMRITYDDGSTSASTVEANSVAFGDSPIVHQTANIGDATARVIVTEVFTTPPTTDPPRALPAAGDVLVDNDTVRMSRLSIAPGAAETLTNTPPLVVVALSAGTVVRSDGDATSLKRGEVLWCDTGTTELRPHSSSDTASFDAIVITLKPRSTSAG